MEKCAVCLRKVEKNSYFKHITARHPKTASLSTDSNIITDKEEVHIFSEISRLAKEMHKKRYGLETKIDKIKIKSFEREIRK